MRGREKGVEKEKEDWRWREGSPSIPKEEDETVTLRRGEEGMWQPRKYIQHRVSLSHIWGLL